MARSTYIYVVIQGSRIVSAFTVKHELVRFLLRFKTSLSSYQVFRVHDGTNFEYVEPVEMVKDELFK